ncbi:MAG TPA: hypothetical protein VFB80_20965, partial [Pirellulaceae bacterium]|nr:hypothetical protein [Pirellulaceae bacterium]
DAEAQRAPNMLLGGEVRMFHQHLSFAMYEAAERLEFDRAADYALAKVRYNTMLSRGGTTGHARMGDHFQEGHRWLEDNRARLSPAKSREVAEILERSTAELDSAELLEQRDVIFADRSGGWSGRLRQILGDR